MSMLDAVAPIFDAFGTLTFDLVEETKSDYEVTNQLFVDLISTCKKTLLGGGYINDQVDNALLAVCALIDERILESDWRYRSTWQRAPLQKHFFDTNVAGSEFFTRLDGLNESNPQHQQVREIYLYCLKQGFSGCYFDLGDQSRLSEITTANFQLLSNKIEPVLFDPKVTSQSVDAPNEYYLEKFKDIALVWGPVVLVISTYCYLRADLFSTLGILLSGK